MGYSVGTQHVFFCQDILTAIKILAYANILFNDCGVYLFVIIADDA